MAAANKNQDLRYKELPTDPYNFDTFEIADWTCFPVYQILETFLETVQNNVNFGGSGHHGMLNLKEDDLRDARKKYILDTIVLLERLMPEFDILANIEDPGPQPWENIPGEDELTKGILKMIHTKQIPVWLVLALQVQQDIHYILLVDIIRAQSELSEAVVQAIATLKEYFDFSEHINITDHAKIYDGTLTQIHKLCEWIKSDFLHAERSRVFQERRENEKDDFVLLKRHPVLCGMMLFHLNLCMQNTGLGLVGIWEAIPAVIHLYNACLAEELLPEPWTDLEALILAQTAERIFHGGRPYKPQEYLRCFMFILKNSTTVSSPDNQSNAELQGSQEEPRLTLEPSAIVERYNNYFQGYDSEFTVDTMKKLLLKSTKIPHTDVDALDGPTKSVPWLESRFKIKLGTKQQYTKISLLKHFERSYKLTIIQLLTALEGNMTNEVFALNINYFSLHMRCHRFLCDLVTEMSLVFMAHFGAM